MNRLIGLIAVLLVALPGCSQKPARYPISGQVRIDGQPLRYGSIMFVPQNSRPSGETIDSEGRFSLTCSEPGDGAVPGVHRVKITAAESLSETVLRWHAPKHYADENKSGISIDVSKPRDDLIIDLTWNGGKPFEERW